MHTRHRLYSAASTKAPASSQSALQKTALKKQQVSYLGFRDFIFLSVHSIFSATKQAKNGNFEAKQKIGTRKYGH